MKNEKLLKKILKLLIKNIECKNCDSLHWQKECEESQLPCVEFLRKKIMEIIK